MAPVPLARPLDKAPNKKGEKIPVEIPVTKKRRKNTPAVRGQKTKREGTADMPDQGGSKAPSRGRPRNDKVTALCQAYATAFQDPQIEWEATTRVAAYAKHPADFALAVAAEVRRLAWARAQDEVPGVDPTTVKSALRRMELEKVPTPPRGRPPKLSDGGPMPPLPRIAAKYGRLAVAESTWRDGASIAKVLEIDDPRQRRAAARRLAASWRADNRHMELVSGLIR